MNTLFLRFASISLTTGFVILMVLLLAPVFRKYYSAKWKYWVWLVLALRLLVPITMPASHVAIVVNVPDGQQSEQMSDEHTQATTPALAEEEEQAYLIQGVASGEEQVPGTDVDNHAQYVPTENTFQGMVEEGKTNFFAEMTLMNWLVFAWMMGMAAYALYYFTGHLVFRSKVNGEGQISSSTEIVSAVRAIAGEMGISRQIRILIYEKAVSPMMIGLLYPTLILPKEDYTKEELQFILRHELTHCRRNDLWYKLLLLVANGIHWYNPIVWLMCREANADLEQSCDDAVLRDAPYVDRKLYTMTILNGISEQVRHENSLSTYFYGGKEELKQRFSNILDMKKRRFGKMALVTVVLCVALASGLLACSSAGENEGTKGNDTDTDTNTILDDSEENIDKNETLGESGTDEVQESYEGPGPDREKVYEELVVDDTYDVYGKGTYQAMWDGIFRITEDGSRECVYEGYPGIEPKMKVCDGILYFRTYTEYTEDGYDWIDDGIRSVNLATLESKIVDIGGPRYCIEDFYIEDKAKLILKINNNGGQEVGYLPVPLYGDVSSLPDHEEFQRELIRMKDSGLAVELANKLTKDPMSRAEFYLRSEQGIEVLMDMDLDGTAEHIVLRYAGDENTHYSVWDEYEFLLNDEVVYEGSAENLEPKVWAFSLDGKEILLALYEDGPSWDPMTTLFRYENGKLVEAGSMETDIRECEFSEDGTISGIIRNDVIQTSYSPVKWRMGESKMLERVPQDIDEFVVEPVELLQEVTVYPEPGSGEAFIMEPQTVTLPRATLDKKWIQLETSDGVTGWLAISDYEHLEDGRETREVFEGLSFAG